MINSLSPVTLAARTTAIMGALAACLFNPPDFCPSGNEGAAR